jgi:O-antigen/teichoic acid export membrane protein
MGFIKKLGTYAFGNVLSLLAGLISFPIFTRMLNPADYGLMSLINLTSALCVIFCKGGLQQALIREWDVDKQHNRMVVSTALFGSMLLTAVVVAILGITAGVAAYMQGTWSYVVYFLITSGLIITETIKAIIYNKIRAMQEALKYNLVTIVAKYGQILFAVLLLMYFSKTAYSLLTGFIAASLLIVSWIIYQEKDYISLASFHFKTFKAMLAFGFPLIFYELTSQLLSFVDRYFIGIYQGAAAVGKYSAAYNLTFYIQNLLVSSVSLTIYPMIVEKMKKDGHAATREFMQESLLWFCLIGSAVTLGFAALGPDIFLITATRKYAEAVVVITPVICGGFLFGIFTVSAGELFVLKNTKAMAGIMAVAALLNMVLDIMLIPAMGLLGAAYATLVPEAFLAVVGLWKMGIFARRGQFLQMLYYCLPSLVMYVMLLFLKGEITWFSIITRIASGIIIWICAVLLMNNTVKKELFVWFGARKSRAKI